MSPHLSASSCQVHRARMDLAAGLTVEAVGAHYSPAAWRSEEGGYVGHIDWRDQHHMGTRSYCGHKHRLEAAALDCIQAILGLAKKG
jgi:hypothetical protein